MECKRTREICRKLEGYGAITYPLIGGAWSPAGWPDRFAAWSSCSGPKGCLTRDGVDTIRDKQPSRKLTNGIELRAWKGFLEFKEHRGWLTDAQAAVCRKLEARGSSVRVIVLDDPARIPRGAESGIAYTVDREMLFEWGCVGELMVYLGDSI